MTKTEEIHEEIMNNLKKIEQKCRGDNAQSTFSEEEMLDNLKDLLDNEEIKDLFDMKGIDYEKKPDKNNG